MRQVAGVVALFLFAVVAFAQTDRGTITGTVLDPCQAPWSPTPPSRRRTPPPAKCITQATTGTGNYTLANLPAGSYELTVAAPGFKKYIRPGLTVQVAETMRADANS
jgi:hypothetical protein